MTVPASLSSVPDVAPYIQYVAASGQTVYPYPFPITEDSDLVVVINGVTQSTDTGYSVSGVGDSTGGNCTLDTGSDAGDIITLYRDVPIERISQISQNSGFSSTVFNNEFNNFYLIAQQLETSLAQCLQIPNTNNPAPTTSLTPASYANKYLAFDANGNPEPAELTSSGSLTPSIIGGLIYPQTAAEVAAGVTPANYVYAAGNVLRYGAVGDGSADDTTALQNALNAGPSVFCQTTGLTFKTTTALTVPTSCYRIDLTGNQISGPGSDSSVDGFYFTGFYQGAGSVETTVVSRRYRLPGIKNYRYGVNLTAAAWVILESEIVQSCNSGIYLDSTSTSDQYCVENVIRVDNIDRCTTGISLNSNSGSDNGIQGCRFYVNYLSACTNAIGGTFDSASATFTFNYFDITVIDGNGNTDTTYAVKFNLAPTNSANFYRIPGDVINQTASPTPYVNVGSDSDFEVLHFRGGYSMDYFAWDNFVPQQPIPVTFPGGGDLTVYVSTSGSDSLGNGSSSAPYATVNHALSQIQNLDCMGQNVTISLAAGTYSDAITYDTTTAHDPQAQIFIEPSGSASVTLSGGVSIFGAGAKVTLQNGSGTLTLSTTGLLAQYSAIVNLGALTFGSMTGAHMTSQNGAVINVTDNYTIAGDASVHTQATYGGTIVCNSGKTITLTGAPVFSQQFIYSAFGGSNQDWSGTTFSGSATGTRYAAVLNGCINTSSGGASFFPGDADGSTSAGGQYV